MAKKKDRLYEVIVGNLGKVYHGADKGNAVCIFGEYRRMSRDGYARVSGEFVSMFVDGELDDEYVPEPVSLDSIVITEAQLYCLRHWLDQGVLVGLLSNQHRSNWGTFHANLASLVWSAERALNVLEKRYGFICDPGHHTNEGGS